MEIEGLDVVIVLILGVVSTLLTPLFTSPRMNSHVKNIISVVVALGISVVYVALTTGWDWGNLGGTLAAVYAINQVVYQQLLKSTSKAIEEKTSGGAVEDDYLDHENDPKVEFAGNENSENL